MKWILSCLAFAFSLSITTGAESITIAENGQASSVIVLPDEPIAAEITAAKELAAYLERISGASFEVAGEGDAPGSGRILVGQSSLARGIIGGEEIDSLGPEEFIVRTVGVDTLVLAGGRPRGTLYAVYSFLEKELGCRWLTWYGDEFIPARKDISVGALDRRGSPAMQVRDIVTHTNVVSDRQDMKRFLIRNRCQGPELDFGHIRNVAAYGGTSHIYGRPKGGHIVHTSFHWMPPAKYFESNPEYYSFLGGQRVPRQLCFSNPGLRKALTAKILHRIGELGGRGNFSVSDQDEHGGPFCECPDCLELSEREGTTGAPLFDYLVEAAGKVAVEYPEAYLTTLAYFKRKTEVPPKTIRFPDNVIIIFCPYHNVNFAASLEHPSNSDTLANLKGWADILDENLWVWYYPNTYGYALPVGNFRRLADDFRLFRRLGVDGYFIEQDAPGVYDSRRLSEMQTWVITKLMWDPDQSMEGLIEDFSEHYYGPAAAIIREYVSSMEEAKASGEGHLRGFADPGEYYFLTGEFLLDAHDLFDRAEEAASGEPVYLERVRYSRMSIDLASLYLWDRIASAGEPPFTRQELTDRYRDTYTRGIRKRAVPEARRGQRGQGEMLKRMESEIGPLEAFRDPEDLPPPLDAVSEELIRQFMPDGAHLHGSEPELITDSLAAAGIAVTDKALMPPPDAAIELQPNAFIMGFYDMTAGRQLNAHAGTREQPIKPNEYHMYHIGRTALSERCYIWFNWNWRIQFRQITELYDPDNPGQEWDIYASIRFEGPAYERYMMESAEEGNRYYVDRVVLVKVE